MHLQVQLSEQVIGLPGDPVSPVFSEFPKWKTLKLKDEAGHDTGAD
jgi:hypothetical protein